MWISLLVRGDRRRQIDGDLWKEKKTAGRVIRTLCFGWRSLGESSLRRMTFGEMPEELKWSVDVRIGLCLEEAFIGDFIGHIYW